ncbi:sensor histidine kinase [Streptomyces sp. FXJ1.4098]|nr:sensor histidine kinase [Streptomyces sp. FXJ1.4098]
MAASRVDAWSALASDRGVRLRMDGTAVTGRHVRSSLEQVLDVLLDNALHVTPGGGSVLVAVHTAASEARVEVRDQGPGMTNEEISHACEPFWRGSSGRDRKGTGLGLTIAAGLLAASGGRLELGHSPSAGYGRWRCCHGRSEHPVRVPVARSPRARRLSGRGAGRSGRCW